MKTSRLRMIVLIFFLLAAGWFFRGMILRGDVFVAADTLHNFYPWKALSGLPVDTGNGLMMDSAQTFYPAHSFAARWLGAGYVPLWNPHIMCGVPFAASGIAGLFYPLNAVFYAAGAAGASFGWNALIHIVLAGLFAFSLLRVLGAGPRGSLIGGLVFAFNGWLVAWMMLPNFLHAGIWLPLMVCLYELSLKRGRAVYAALGGVAGAMPFLAGQPQVAAYSHMLLFGYAAYRTFTMKDAAWRAAAYWLVGVAASIAVSAVQVLPTLELMMRSQRTAIPGGASKYLGVPGDLKHLVLAFMPNFYGDPRNRPIPELGNYSALCMYCGALPLLLAFYGAVFGRMRARLFFAAAGILALLLALGTPLTALFSVIPGLNMIDSHRILFLYTFAVPVLAGIGWEAIEKKSGARAPGVWALFGVFAASAILFALWAAKAGVGSSGPGAGVIMKLALPAFAGLALMLLKKPALRIRWAAAVVIIFLDLVLWAGWYAPTTPKKYLFPETPSTLLLEQDRGLFRIHGVGDDWLLLPNTAMQYGLNDIRGIESLYPERYFHLINAVSGRKFGIINDRRNVLEIFGHDSPFVDMINVKYIFSTDPITEPGNEQYAELMKEDMRVTLNRGAFPRFYGVRAAYVMDSPLSVLKAVSAPDFNPAAGILLDRENSGLEPGFYPQDASAGMIALDIAGLDYRPGDIGFSVTAPEACWLASSEPQDPGWLAYIDGEPAQVFTANYHFRAVRLPGGKHSVEFRYRPRTVHAGAVSALAACLLLLLWIFAGKRLPASRHKGRF